MTPNGNTAAGIRVEMICISFGGCQKPKTLFGWFRTNSGSQHLHLCFVLLKITEVPPSPYPFGCTRLGGTDRNHKCRCAACTISGAQAHASPQAPYPDGSLPTHPDLTRNRPTHPHRPCNTPRG